MAKILIDEQTILMRPWQSWLRVIITGAAVGLLFWIITTLLTRYVIEPLTCRELANAAQCLGSNTLAGNVAAILTALAAILIMVRLNVIQPVIIAIGSAAILWDLSTWTGGLFWAEAIGWSILLYALSYALFSWLTRYTRMIPAIIGGIIVILLIRILLIL